MKFIDWYYSQARCIFNNYISVLGNNGMDLSQRTRLLRFFMRVARATNLYASPELERWACSMADEIGDEKDSQIAVRDNRVLHVVTRLKAHGGHSRLLERWLEFDDSYINDVAILDVASDVPARLQAVEAQKGSQILFVSGCNDIDQAKSLRQMASGYHHIVLHVNYNEIIHMLAFGSKKFKRPVLLMNHTDHLFWMGSSIADLVINMSSAAQAFTEKKRGNARNVVLPIPLSEEVFASTDNENERDQVRQGLGIMTENRVVLSSGHFYKYSPISLKESFHYKLFMLLKQSPDMRMIVVGIKPCRLSWRVLKLLFGERILLKESCQHDELNKLLTAADIYVDSYPISGFTALCEALAKDIPIIPIDTGFAYFDSLKDDLVSPDMLVEEIQCVMSRQMMIDGKKRLAQHLPEMWQASLNSIHGRIPQVHSIQTLLPISTQIVELDRTFFFQSGGQLINFSFFRLNIPSVVKIKLLACSISRPLFVFPSMLLRVRILLMKGFF